VTFVRDVTSVVELEREVSRAERIDSLGKLAGGIAHDFNNLLTVIMGQVDILAEDLGADHWTHEYLATIMDACERSATLTSKVLDFSRKQTLRPTVFLADEAIRGLVPLLRQLVPERIALDLAINPDDEPRVRCDPSRFEQILLNLVANARDAIEDSGTITLRLRTHPSGGEGDRRTLGEVEIEVADDGTGMSKEVQDRIFDPFFTTKPVGEGTGLGLSTVHGIVHQSGGRIEVSSRVGHGTTLRVFLPGTDAELTRPMPEPRRTHTIDGRRRTVLVVEDNDSVRALVTRTLVRLGFEVVAAQDGHEAQAWIEDRERDFEALISDIVMPGRSGVEVARLFRARFARRRIVLMSGYAEDEIGPIERLPSDIRFVQKPITAKILGEALA
jgi:two-component system cell cycle sensor histidine kinase/response regulator CckA